MNDFEILYISLGAENEFFIKHQKTIHNGIVDFLLRENIHTQIRYLDMKDIRSIDFNRYRRKNIYVIFNIDKQFCKQFNKSEHLLYEIERISRGIISSQLLIMSHGTCQALVDYTPLSKYMFFQYEDIEEGLYRSIDYLKHIILSNHRDRDILKDTSKAEFLLKEKEKEIKELENKFKTDALESEKQKEEKQLLKDEAQKLKEKITLLEEEKQKETNNIEKIIKFLAAMPKEISDEQGYLEKRRQRFTLLGGLSFSLGVISIFILIINILLTTLPAINGASSYLAYVFPVVFPMVISFLFYRQANMKSKEIEKINEKSILVQQVENALNSYNVLLSGDELKDKTISSIDRVINKIFDNNHKEEKNEKTEENKLTISDVQKLFKMGTDITKA